MDSGGEAEFDRVVVSEDGNDRALTVEEFIALPLKVRVEFIVSDALRFFHGAAVVDPSHALRWLRNRRKLQA